MAESKANKVKTLRDMKRKRLLSEYGKKLLKKLEKELKDEKKR